MTAHSLSRLAVCLTISIGSLAQSPHARPHTPAPPRRPPVFALPQLGDEVPEAILKRTASPRSCDVGASRTDPCTTLTSGRDRITIAWDAATHRVTYLYSTTLQTDADIRSGDLLGIDSESPITPFPAPGSPHRFVTIDWCDTDRDLSREALWCAVMLPVRPRSGKVVGFVQSLYMYLPEFERQPMHRVSVHDNARGHSRWPRALSWDRPPHRWPPVPHRMRR